MLIRFNRVSVSSRVPPLGDRLTQERIGFLESEDLGQENGGTEGFLFRRGELRALVVISRQIPDDAPVRMDGLVFPAEPVHPENDRHVHFREIAPLRKGGGEGRQRIRGFLERGCQRQEIAGGGSEEEAQAAEEEVLAFHG